MAARRSTRRNKLLWRVLGRLGETRLTSPRLLSRERASSGRISQHVASQCADMRRKLSRNTATHRGRNTIYTCRVYTSSRTATGLTTARQDRRDDPRSLRFSHSSLRLLLHHAAHRELKPVSSRGHSVAAITIACDIDNATRHDYGFMTRKCRNNVNDNNNITRIRTYNGFVIARPDRPS